MIKIEKYKIDLALYVINLKIANIIKDNEDISYEKFKQKILTLEKEKEEIYKQNEEIILKVLNVYLEELKK